MTTREHLEELKKVLNISEYHKAGFKGQGVIVASMEETKDGHGSNVMDTVLTYAPDCKVISFTDVKGYSSMSDNGEHIAFPEFVDWCIENKVDIVTSSLDWSCDKEVERNAIKKLYENGIIFCNCASNEGSENKFSNIKKTWSFDKEVICVSGYMHNVNGKFTWSGFNYGEAVDVLGCGSNCPTMSRDSNVVYSWSGTSSATPMIAGMLATLKSANKNLNSKNVFNIIENNYIPLIYKDREYKILVLPPLELIGEYMDKFENETWAKEALKWAEEVGLSDCTRLDDNITRREVIVMLYRLFKLYE